jgi:hypothetical protein
VALGLLDGKTLLLDGADGLVDFIGTPRPDLLLLPFQQDDHFGVLFQFLAQGADQICDVLGHELVIA